MKPLLLFDFGCVLVSLDKQRCIRALRRAGCGAIASYVDEHRSEDLFHDIELGGSAAHFCQEARRQSGSTATDDDICAAWNALLTGIDPVKLRRIDALHRQGYRTAILSNTNKIHWQHSLRHFFTADGHDVDYYFDYVFLSCDLGMVKPDARIYRHVCQATGTAPGDILFFDDSRRNCEGARACGLNAVYDPDGYGWMSYESGVRAFADVQNAEEWPGGSQPDPAGHPSPLTPHSSLPKGTAATIGNFDGVHLGHRYVLDTLRGLALGAGLSTLAVSFDQHPRTLFDPAFRPAYLTPAAEKRQRLLAAGADRVLLLPFTRELAAMPARDFMAWLHEAQGVRLLLLGYDNRFGQRREGEGTDDYIRYGRELGIEVRVAGALRADGPQVSSSLVRHAVLAGDMERAAAALGRPYTISGTVVHGMGNGRRLGFPTANIDADPLKLLPANGVYHTTANLDGHTLHGLTNIGHRPTFHGHDTTIETHLLDYTGDLYGHQLTITLLHRLRPEQHFPTPQALREQMERDAQTVREAAD